MTLTLRNKTKYKLYADALVMVAGQQGISRIPIPPIQPGQTKLQTWPHPIIQLCLCNFRVEK